MFTLFVPILLNFRVISLVTYIFWSRPEAGERAVHAQHAAQGGRESRRQGIHGQCAREHQHQV